MDDNQLQERLSALENRIRHLEDDADIRRLITSWGPAVDVGDDETAASLFTDDGILESDLGYLTGRPAVAAMVLGEGHQSLIRGGSAHIPAYPIVKIDGDTAAAIGYTRVYRHTEDGYDIWRVSANRWEFRREPDGWRVAKRTNHVIDGGPQAPKLLSSAFEGG
jgi:ketosteroid isomerase-like protein